MAIENLPKDPMMLLSFVNTRLRDDGINLDSFCLQFRTAREDLEQKLEELIMIRKLLTILSRAKTCGCGL